MRKKKRNEEKLGLTEEYGGKREGRRRNAKKLGGRGKGAGARGTTGETRRGRGGR